MMCFLPVAFHDFDFSRAVVAIGPLEANSRLIVDANAPLVLTLALYCLQTVTGTLQIPRPVVTSS